MKKILIVLTLLLAASASLMALNKSLNQRQQMLKSAQDVWMMQTQQLFEVRTQAGRLNAKVGRQEEELQADSTDTAIEPRLVAFLQTNEIQNAPPELQREALAAINLPGISTKPYVLVSKAALANAELRPLKSYPENDRLTDSVRGVLAITPDEQEAVEASFDQAYTALATWAGQNLQRQEPTNDIVVQYAIPEDTSFRQAWMQALFSNISSAIGDERAGLLRKYFEVYALYEDAAIGDRTNVLMIQQIPTPPGYSFRAGWRWANHSEAINTKPTPIKTKNFPLAFRFVFPGGWAELAQREGFQLPDEFNQH